RLGLLSGASGVDADDAVAAAGVAHGLVRVVVQVRRRVLVGHQDHRPSQYASASDSRHSSEHHARACSVPTYRTSRSSRTGSRVTRCPQWAHSNNINDGQLSNGAVVLSPVVVPTTRPPRLSSGVPRRAAPAAVAG